MSQCEFCPANICRGIVTMPSMHTDTIKHTMTAPCQCAACTWSIQPCFGRAVRSRCPRGRYQDVCATSICKGCSASHLQPCRLGIMQILSKGSGFTSSMTPCQSCPSGWYQDQDLTQSIALGEWRCRRYSPYGFDIDFVKKMSHM